MAQSCNTCFGGGINVCFGSGEGSGIRGDDSDIDNDGEDNKKPELQPYLVKEQLPEPKRLYRVSNAISELLAKNATYLQAITYRSIHFLTNEGNKMIRWTISLPCVSSNRKMAMFCLLARATCHLFSSHSERGCLMQRVDYACSAALIATSGIYIGFIKIPERWKPRKFDIAGHGHQLFHVLVVAEWQLIGPARLTSPTELYKVVDNTQLMDQRFQNLELVFDLAVAGDHLGKSQTATKAHTSTLEASPDSTQSASVEFEQQDSSDFKIVCPKCIVRCE
ncbi:unnamed protein product [Dovyalis caffra]|uniref:Uncharacterized protein n=1 Tax=Dovyalis caffra TaxID=77055 RepID=A0AAV1S7G3_9ROSI|nr:unnamed protein product [Dovyalis caffra]